MSLDKLNKSLDEFGDPANNMLNLLNDIGNGVIKLYLAAMLATYYFESGCNPMCGIDEDSVKKMLYGAMIYVSSLGLIDHEKMLDLLEAIVKKQ